MRVQSGLKFFALLVSVALLAGAAGFQAPDGLKIRSVGVVRFSPDGTRIAYTITRNDGPRQAVRISFGS